MSRYHRSALYMATNKTWERILQVLWSHRKSDDIQKVGSQLITSAVTNEYYHQKGSYHPFNKNLINFLDRMLSASDTYYNYLLAMNMCHCHFRLSAKQTLALLQSDLLLKYCLPKTLIQDDCGDLSKTKESI